MIGLTTQKTETLAFDELSAAISHLQHEMSNLRQVKPGGILARIKQESSDLEMIDDSKENTMEASVSTPKNVVPLAKQKSLIFEDFPSTPTLAQLGLSSRALAHIETPPLYPLNKSLSKHKHHTGGANGLAQIEVMGEGDAVAVASLCRHSLSSSSVSMPSHHLPRTSLSSQCTPQAPQSNSAPFAVNDVDSNVESTPIAAFPGYDHSNSSNARDSFMDMPSSAQFNRVSKEGQGYRPFISDSEGYND